MFTGKIGKNIYPGNKYDVTVGGVTGLVVTSVAKVNSEGIKVELPDKSHAASGWNEAGEVEVTVPMHADETIAVFNEWHAAGYKGNAVPETAYRQMNIIVISNDLKKSKQFVLGAATCKSSSNDDLSMDDGTSKMTQMTYTIAYDEMTFA